MKLRLLLLVIGTAFTVGGCGSPGVVQLSPDTYMVRKEDHGGIFAFNRGNLKSDAIREANAFAEKQNKVAVPISGQEHPMGVLGDWAAYEYQFRVVDKNDPAARGGALLPRPDVVIQKDERITGDIRTKDVSAKPPDLYTELTKLDDLRKKGLITDAEYEEQKQKLLKRSQ